MVDPSFVLRGPTAAVDAGLLSNIVIYLGIPIGVIPMYCHSEYPSATTSETREQAGHMRIAIVGTGVSGLVCAHLLSRQHDVTVFEADGRPGGHAHTVTVDLPDGSFDVDTGFLI